MPRYEFKEGSSSKFWEIELAGKAFTTKWGRIGTDGQSLTKSFKDDAAAKKEYEKLVAEKTKKGYALVSNGKGLRAAPAKPAKPKALPVASNPKLEQAILADPDDESAWLVYGDWLQEQGDPRGELLALHAKKQKSRADKLLAINEDALLGPAAKWLKDGAFAEMAEYGAEDVEIALTWRYGFIDSVHANGFVEHDDFGEAFRAIFSSPVGGFIRNVSLDFDEDSYAGESGQPNWGPVVRSLAKAEPRNLRRLSFSCGSYQLSWTQLGGLAPLMPYLEKLESLHVNLGEIDLGKTVHLPKCNSLVLETGGLMASSVKAIAAAKWPSLETLTLYLGRDDYGGNAKVKDLQGIFDASGFPKLKNLALCNAEIQNDIAKAIGKSKIVKQLDSLDLSKGTMDDTGAKALLESATAFKHLKQVDLSENYLSDEMTAQLRKLAKKVLLDGQRLDEDEDPEWRYTVVGE